MQASPIPRSRRSWPSWGARQCHSARRWCFYRSRNREVGQGGEVLGRKAGLIRARSVTFRYAKPRCPANCASPSLMAHRVSWRRAAILPESEVKPTWRGRRRSAKIDPKADHIDRGPSGYRRRFWHERDFGGCLLSCHSRKFHPCGFARLGGIRASSAAMLAMLHLLGTFVVNLFKSRRRLESREPLSSASAQYCPEACTAPSADCVGVTGHCW
jgi:hypothetical protein